MTINANTKIAAILKQHPDALEAIISISPKFEKLRNPLLRKIMAGRTSISMASKIGGCTVDDFFQKLKALGFEIDRLTPASKEEKKSLPEFITTLKNDQIVNLDVRAELASGSDPFHSILGKVKSLQTGEVLKIINTFEPIPLIRLLEKQGFTSYTDVLGDDHVETYFYKKPGAAIIEQPAESGDASRGWDEILERFRNNLQTIDVRALEMPQPMIQILDAIEKLPEGQALYVHHKRIPVFLLPELRERNLDYRIKEVSDSEVHLLIFR